MNSVFDGWDDVDVEEFIDADQDGDELTKQRIASHYGMNAEDIFPVQLMTPIKKSRWQSVKGQLWRWWYAIFPHPLER
jgi:hypothetical protein